MRTTGMSIELGGVVASGLGEGARFTAIDWVVEEFRRKLGFVPHPGTFNLRMAGARWDVARPRLLAATGIAITPSAGFCAAKCFPVVLAGRLSGALVLPDMHDYPGDKFEVVAPVPVREALGVANGDLVALQIDISRGVPPLPIGAAPRAPAPPPRETAWLTRGERS